MSRHLLIAGTGRAGTSFLVRYLTQLGLDTHLSRSGPDASWDEAANAGLEDLPIGNAGDLPYVIKSPWTFQLIHDALATGSLEFDAVILPMRDLTEAAASRSIVERQHLHDTHPWMSNIDTIWEQHGLTPGGIVFSLSPVDQARLLAVGFHQLLERLVRDEIPVILLSFPRLVEDADYVYRKLASVLPETITAEAARAAHIATAEPSKVRVNFGKGGPATGFVMNGPGPLRLECAALRRSLSDAQRDTETVRAELAGLRAMLREAEAASQREASHRRAAEEAFVALSAERDKDAESARAQQDAFQRETEAIRHRLNEAQATQGSLRAFLRHYLPRLRGYLLGR